MRFIAVVACLSACVTRLDTTRVTLFDRSELAVEGTGKLQKVPPGLVENDLVLFGRSADVLAFDGDRLRMRLIQRSDCRRHCTPLELRIDTPLANVRTIRDVGVASHQVIPLGLFIGTLFTVVGGGSLAYAEHDGGQRTAPALALGFGLALLALEIHARLASDTVTVVR